MYILALFDAHNERLGQLGHRLWIFKRIIVDHISQSEWHDRIRIVALDSTQIWVEYIMKNIFIRVTILNKGWRQRVNKSKVDGDERNDRLFLLLKNILRLIMIINMNSVFISVLYVYVNIVHAS